MNKKQKGFVFIEGLLILAIIAVIGGTGYYVWHHSKSKNKTPSATAATAQTTNDKSATADTSSGSSSKKYLTISRWGVKMTESDPSAGFYYQLSDNQTEGSDSDITIYSTKADAIVGPEGVSCKGEYIAYVLRLPSNDSKWSDPDVVSPLFSEKKQIGGYTYAQATKKEYGPNCWNKGTSSNYEVDQATSDSFEVVVDEFTQDFLNLQAN